MKAEYAAFFLAAALFTGITAQAESLAIDTEKVEAEAKAEKQGIRSDDLNDIDKERSIFDVGSTDIVTISEDIYDVQTDILSCRIEVPFGWLCLTQDFKLQYDTFNYIYKDPLAAAKDMVSEGVHYFLLDYDFENSIEIYFSEDYLGTLVGNAAELDDDDSDTVFKIINNNYFTSMQGETEMIGNKRFYHFWNDDGTAHYFETYVKSICVDVFVENLSGNTLEDYILEDTESVLEGMTFES